MAIHSPNLIIDHWRRFGRASFAEFSVNGAVRVPVEKQIEFATPGPGKFDPTETFDVLTFRLEKGFIDGVPMYRVNCEDVIVEVGPLK